MGDAAAERAGGGPNGVTGLGGVCIRGETLAQRSRIRQCVSQWKVAGSGLARDSARAGDRPGHFGDQTRWPSGPCDMASQPAVLLLARSVDAAATCGPEPSSESCVSQRTLAMQHLQQGRVRVCPPRPRRRLPMLLHSTRTIPPPRCPTPFHTSSRILRPSCASLLSVGSSLVAGRVQRMYRVTWLKHSWMEHVVSTRSDTHQNDSRTYVPPTDTPPLQNPFSICFRTA